MKTEIDHFMLRVLGFMALSRVYGAVFYWGFMGIGDAKSLGEW